jgi:hypothetical protein
LATERKQRQSSQGGAGEFFAELSSNHELFVCDWEEFVKTQNDEFMDGCSFEGLNFLEICHTLAFENSTDRFGSEEVLGMIRFRRNLF